MNDSILDLWLQVFLLWMILSFVQQIGLRADKEGGSDDFYIEQRYKNIIIVQTLTISKDSKIALKQIFSFLALSGLPRKRNS